MIIDCSWVVLPWTGLILPAPGIKDLQSNISHCLFGVIDNLSGNLTLRRTCHIAQARNALRVFRSTQRGAGPLLRALLGILWWFGCLVKRQGYHGLFGLLRRLLRF